MKQSRVKTSTTRKSLAAALEFVDVEISKIVADIAADRTAKPARKPRYPRPRAHAHAA